MRTNGNKTVERLNALLCFFIDTPPNRQDCSTVDPTECIQCGLYFRYLAGDGTDDKNSAGHLVCWTMWLVCVLVGVLGVLGNILIIAVLKKRSSSTKGFDFLLKVLAWIDLFCCVVGVITISGRISILNNWSGRGAFMLYLGTYSWTALQFLRSASQGLTVTLTIERFLAITFPFRTQTWFSIGRTRIAAGCAGLYAVLMLIPRAFNSALVDNKYRHDKLNVPSIHDLDYLMKATKLGRFWNHTLGSAHNRIDFWGPLPILLIFNFLSFLQILKLSKRRKDMKVTLKRDIQAVKMFLPVVVVLIVLNLVPIANFATAQFQKTVYREVLFATYLSITLNSAVNFLIYYLSAGPFRAETHAILPSWMKAIFHQTRSARPGASGTTQDNVTPTSSGTAVTKVSKIEMVERV